MTTKIIARDSLLLISIVLLTGCASLDDFKKMTPSQRAERVCTKQARNSYESNEIDRLESVVRELGVKINTGYTVHERCTWVEREKSSRLSCRTINGYTSCSDSSSRGSVYSCAELSDAMDGRITLPINVRASIGFFCDRKCVGYHVPLDTASLQRERTSAEDRIRSLENQREGAYRTCYAHVYSLDAEQSFSLHTNRPISRSNASTGYSTYDASKALTKEQGQSCNASGECKGSMLCVRGVCAQR